MTNLTKLALSLSFSLALAACGGSRHANAPSAAGVPSAPGAPSAADGSDAGAGDSVPQQAPPVHGPSDTSTDLPPAGDLESGLAAIRVLGVENPGFTSVLVAVKSLEAWVDGVQVPVDFSRVSPAFELTNGAHAWLAGRIAMPPAGSTVRVRLVLDEAGAFEAGPAAGALRICGPAIEFDHPAELFALGGHAVVHLDLTRSILGAGDARDLVPQLQVKY